MHELYEIAFERDNFRDIQRCEVFFKALGMLPVTTPLGPCIINHFPEGFSIHSTPSIECSTSITTNLELGIEHCVFYVVNVSCRGFFLWPNGGFPNRLRFIRLCGIRDVKKNGDRGGTHPFARYLPRN